MLLTSDGVVISLLTTQEAARALGLTLCQLQGMLRRGVLSPPARTPAGGFLWSESDLARAREVLAQRRQMAVPAIQAAAAGR